MAKVTLTNNFHHSSVVLNCETVSHIYGEVTIRPTTRQIAKAKKALCGKSGCECSRADGTRGHQTHNGKNLTVDLSSLYAATN